MTLVFCPRKKIVGLFVALVFVTQLPCCAAWARKPETARTFVVIESVDIQKENKAKAREQAIAKSLKTAVNRAVSELVPKDTLLYHFKAFHDAFAGNTDRYIQTYKVLTEAYSQTRYGVVVEVGIALDAIRGRINTAGINLDTRGLPTLLVLVSEAGLDDMGPRYWWAPGMSRARLLSETAILEKLKSSGFRIIAHKDPQGAFDMTPYADTPVLETADLKALGEFYKADVVISGFSETSLLPNAMGSDIRSFRGICELKAVRTDSGEILTSTRQQFSTASSEEVSGSADAMTSAAAMAAEEIANSLVGLWRVKKQKEGMLEVEVTGTSYLSSFVKFRRKLRELPGVANVQVKEMKADRGTLSVDYAGSAKVLADLLVRQNFDSFGITILAVDKGRLQLRMETSRKTGNVTEEPRPGIGGSQTSE